MNDSFASCSHCCRPAAVSLSYIRQKGNFMQSVCVSKHFKPAAAVYLILALLPVRFDSDFFSYNECCCTRNNIFKTFNPVLDVFLKRTDKSIDRMLMYSSISDIVIDTDQPLHYNHRQVRWITLIILLHWHVSVGGIYQAASEHFVLEVVVLEAGKMEGSEWVWHGPGSEHLPNFPKKWPEEGQQLTLGLGTRGSLMSEVSKG